MAGASARGSKGKGEGGGLVGAGGCQEEEQGEGSGQPATTGRSGGERRSDGTQAGEEGDSVRWAPPGREGGATWATPMKRGLAGEKNGWAQKE
jgi:hypothetical protein